MVCAKALACSGFFGVLKMSIVLGSTELCLSSSLFSRAGSSCSPSPYLFLLALFFVSFSVSQRGG